MDNMLQVNVIEPAESECTLLYSSPKNGSGSLRCCTYYIKLNLVTVKHAFQIPQTDESFNSLHRGCIFLILEANFGY